MGAVEVKPMEELRLLAAAVNQRRSSLKAAGIDFEARAARRVTLHGVLYELRLGVLPLTGFDDFAWAAYFRPWIGPTRPVDHVESKVNRVLDSYAAGETPPGPGFM